MAAKRPSRKSKTQRGASTVTELPIVASAAGKSTTWVSIPRTLSRVNHRLYRENLNYYAEVSVSSATPTNVDVYTLMPTWYVLGALKAAKKMHDEAMKEEGRVIDKARWYDFRITHDFSSATYAEGYCWGFDSGFSGVQTHGHAELLESHVFDHNGNERVFTLRTNTGGVWSGATAYNVFEEFDAMGNVDPSPDTISSSATTPYNDLIGNLDNENMVELESRGNLPPYNQNSWDAVWVRVGQLLISSTGTQTVSSGVFQAPLGLVLLSGYGTDSEGIGAGPNATIHVVPGNTKGVLTTAL